MLNILLIPPRVVKSVARTSRKRSRNVNMQAGLLGCLALLTIGEVRAATGALVINSNSTDPVTGAPPDVISIANSARAGRVLHADGSASDWRRRGEWG